MIQGTKQTNRSGRRSRRYLPLFAVLVTCLVAIPAILVSSPAFAVAGSPAVGVASNDQDGGWIAYADGSVKTFGGAANHGDMSKVKLNQPVVGIASTADHSGYWLVASDGGIFSFGTASFYGSTGNIKLNKPMVGMAGTPTGQGYWLVASDGGVFAYGDAQFWGSTGSIKLNKPVVGMAATDSSLGYLLVASDGGVFAFGDARFHGSTASMPLNAPIVGISPSAEVGGYLLIARDGGVFAYGDAPFLGSLGSSGIKNIAGLVTDSNGYIFVDSSGKDLRIPRISGQCCLAAAILMPSSPVEPPGLVGCLTVAVKSPIGLVFYLKF